MTVKRLITIYATQLSLHWGLYAILFPVQVLLMLSRGVDMLDVGILIAVFSATTFLLEVPTGTLADQMGRKKIYFWSLVAQGVAFIAFLYSQHFWHLVIGVVALGVARALATGTLDAWFVEKLKQVDRHYPLDKAMAWVSGVMTLALGGVTLGAGLLPSFPVGLSSPYDLNIVVGLGMIPVVAIYTWVFIKESPSPHHHGDLVKALRQFPTMLSASVQLIRRPAMSILMTTMAFAGFAYFAIENFWQPQLTLLMSDPVKQSWWLGLTAACFFGANALGNLLFPLVSDRLAWPSKWIMVLAFWGVGVTMVFVGWQGQFIGFLVLYSCHTLFWGIGEPAYERLFHERVPDHLRSSLTSSQSLVMQTGGVLGALGLGALADATSVALAWSLAGAIFLASGLLFIRLDENRDRTA